jgi:hypothetical protein
MALTYTHIIEVLMSGDIGKYVPEGLAHSFPVIGMENGKIVDCFFIFSYSRGKNEFNSPLARLAIDPIAKKLVYYRDVAESPFETDNESHSYPLEFKSSKDERRVALTKYEKRYVSVRKFAFAAELNAAQHDELLKYMKAFNVLIAATQRPFYIALSPSFFEWMIGMVKQ